MNVIQKIYTSFMHGPVYVIFFGLIFFGIGAGLSYHQYILVRDGAQVQGQVIGLAETCNDDGCTYSPIVRFQTLNGETVTYESNFSSSPPAYDVGEKVTVLYKPDAPEKANIKGEGSLLRIIFMIAGGIVIIIGLVIFTKNLSASFLDG